MNYKKYVVPTNTSALLQEINKYQCHFIPHIRLYCGEMFALAVYFHSLYLG